MELYKPLKICKDYNTRVDIFRIPKNAVYGRYTQNKYVLITDFKQFRKPQEKYSVFILDLKKSNGFRRYHMSKNYYVIPFLWRFIKDNNLYNITVIPVDRAGVPQERRVPVPQSRCFKQCQVDGSGYNISWEEKHYQPINAATKTPYTGFPTQYRDKMPVATFAEFEGYTDSPVALRRDGLKIDQTKCRPGKPVTVNSPKSTQ